MKIDVVVLEWTTDLTRDRLVSSLISNYLILNDYNVAEGPLQNGRYILDKYQPSLLLLVNTIGSKLAIEMAKYAKKIGITVVSLFGEGVFSKDTISQCIWGHNKSKEIIDDFRLVWNKGAYKLVIEAHPNLSHTTYIGGSVGADNYVIGNTKSILPSSLKNEYSCVVGVGCWNFCLTNPNDHRYEIFKNDVGEMELDRIVEDGKLFNEEIIKLIECQPDVLFLIKEHPHKSNFHGASGVDGTKVFDNVIFVDKDENIVDCINSSDIWLSYESTTALEAWLCGVQTALLNPMGVNFMTCWRSLVYKGQPNYENAILWMHAIDSFKVSGTIPDFESLQQERKQLLSDTFGYSDGFNHVRVGNFIIDVLNNKITTSNCASNFGVSSRDKIFSYVKNSIWNLNSFMKKNHLLKYVPRFMYRFIVRHWNEEQLGLYMKSTREKQLEFYKSKLFDLNSLTGIRYEKK